MSKREREGASSKKASKRVADDHKFVLHNLASASVEVSLHSAKIVLYTL